MRLSSRTTTCPTKYTTDCSGMAKGEIYEGAKEPRKPCAKQAARSEGEAMGGFQYEGAQRIEANLHEENIAYGCLFCMTGKEQSVAERIQAACPDVRAITMRKINYRVCKKVKRTEEVIVLPGYVFFQAPSYIEQVLIFHRQNMIRTLSTEGDWRLRGADEQFTRLAFPIRWTAEPFPGVSGRRQNSYHQRPYEGRGGQDSPGG